MGVRVKAREKNLFFVASLTLLILVTIVFVALVGQRSEATQELSLENGVESRTVYEDNPWHLSPLRKNKPSFDDSEFINSNEGNDEDGEDNEGGSDEVEAQKEKQRALDKKMIRDAKNMQRNNEHAHASLVNSIKHLQKEIAGLKHHIHKQTHALHHLKHSRESGEGDESHDAEAEETARAIAAEGKIGEDMSLAELESLVAELRRELSKLMRQAGLSPHLPHIAVGGSMEHRRAILEKEVSSLIHDIAIVTKRLRDQNGGEKHDGMYNLKHLFDKSNAAASADEAAHKAREEKEKREEEEAEKKEKAAAAAAAAKAKAKKAEEEEEKAKKKKEEEEEAEKTKKASSEEEDEEAAKKKKAAEKAAAEKQVAGDVAAGNLVQHMSDYIDGLNKDIDAVSKKLASTHGLKPNSSLVHEFNKLKHYLANLHKHIAVMKALVDKQTSAHPNDPLAVKLKKYEDRVLGMVKHIHDHMSALRRRLFKELQAMAHEQPHETQVQKLEIELLERKIHDLQGGLAKLLERAAEYQKKVLAGKMAPVVLPPRRFYKWGHSMKGGGWKRYGFGLNALYLDVDTSTHTLPDNPLFFTSISGKRGHSRLTGMAAIYNPSRRGFKVYVRDVTDFALTPSYAAANQWQLNWIAFYNGDKEDIKSLDHIHFGVSNHWHQYDKKSLDVNIDTYDGHYKVTPVYFTSVTGARDIWLTTGATAIYESSLDHMKLWLRLSDKKKVLSTIDARKYGWAVNWLGVGNIHLPNLRFGMASNWENVIDNHGQRSVMAKVVYDPPCNEKPVVVTSMTGALQMWATTGSTSIYNMTHEGFHVVVKFTPNYERRSVSETLALKWDWTLNWLAAGCDGDVPME